MPEWLRNFFFTFRGKFPRIKEIPAGFLTRGMSLVTARGTMEGFLIQLTRLNGIVFFLNPHQIEYMESNPDTTLVMLSGKRVVVKESIDEVRARIVEYRRLIGAFKNEE
jgi:flagellar protein FlbD